MAASLQLGEVEEEDRPEFQEATNALQRSNMYEVVVMATFGGVTMTHLHGQDSLVHPFCLFFMCLPALSVQVTALTYLKLGYDLTVEVFKTSGENEAVDRLVADLKVMMIVVVQATMFSRILGNLRVLIFLLTPDTWSQVQRPSPDEIAKKYTGMAWAYRWPFVAPPAVLSVALHLVLCYNICVESVSIILSAPNMKAAIFDSMAITFLADLGEQWWTVVSMVLHMNSDPDFEFKQVSKKKLSRHEIPMLRRMKCFCPVEGKILRKAVVVTVMLFICIRQIYMVSIAKETGILPAARDVCAIFHFNNGTSHNGMMLRKAAFDFTEKFLLWSDPKDAINEIVPRDINCSNTTYNQWGWERVKEAPLEHPDNALKILALVLCVLLAQIWYNFSGVIMRYLERPTEELHAWGVEKLESSDLLKGAGLGLSYLSAERKASGSSASSESSDSEDLRQEVEELRARLVEQEQERRRLALALRRLEEKLK